MKGLPLTLYLTSTNKFIEALLAQEVGGTEKPFYYLSRLSQGAELNYSPIERHYHALIFAKQKLRHYFLTLYGTSCPDQSYQVDRLMVA